MIAPRLPSALAAENAAYGAKPAGLDESGSVSDFDDGTTSSHFGLGWSVSNDAMAGGKSSATIAVADDGANGSTKSLAIAGTISNAFPAGVGRRHVHAGKAGVPAGRPLVEERAALLGQGRWQDL